jgi:hypothetical protein
MARFRKKPVEVEAVQLTTWQAVLDCAQWIRGYGHEVMVDSEALTTTGTPALHIKTLEGVMGASCRDWIIRGVQGEFYPCKPDIFEATYDPVEGGET